MAKAIDGTKTQVQYYSTKKHYYQRIEDNNDEALRSSRSGNKIISLIDPKDSFLDIACGTGSVVETYKINRANYYGIDMSSIGLKIMKDMGRGNPVRGDASRLPFKTGTFDNVISTYSIEHFLEPEKILKEMMRVTRVGGKIIIEGISWDYVGAFFPQLVHMTPAGRLRVRLNLLFRLIRNEIWFKYSPLVMTDVAAFVNPALTDPDADAVHFALVQETYKLLEKNGFRVLHVSDHMYYNHNISRSSRIFRKSVYIFKPLISRIPVIRWFVSLFPLVAVKYRESL